jgi:hypothetical protein
MTSHRISLSAIGFFATHKWEFFLKFFASNPQMPTVYPHLNKKRSYNTHIGWRRMIRESAELYSVLSIITPH